MNIDEAIRIVDEIEKLTEFGGSPDPESLETVRRRIFSLRFGLEGDPPIGVKLASIESWANILFSTRKHKRHGGASRVSYFILRDCITLKDIIRRADALCPR